VEFGDSLAAIAKNAKVGVSDTSEFFLARPSDSFMQILPNAADGGF
jgi:hypothetical protein